MFVELGFARLRCLPAPTIRAPVYRAAGVCAALEADDADYAIATDNRLR
ncbi:MAG: hypothetical protein AAGF11_47465 [Myxococcota bacterium]